MTDQELATYLGLDGDPRAPRIIAALDPARRATYERMHEVEGELNLWQAGLGPKPTGVIVCRPHGRRDHAG